MLPEPAPVAEYRGVDRALFEKVIRPAGQPAVLRGLAADWPAVQAASRSDEEILAYLHRLQSGRPVVVLVGDPETGGRFFYREGLASLNFSRAQAPLAGFMKRLLAERRSPKPYALAVQSEPIPALFPGFEKENRTDLLDETVVPRAWIGNAIQVAPHYDLKENIGCVVAGRRRFTLFPPGQIANLYTGPLELTPAGTPVSLVDPSNPDLERYPRYREAAAVAQSALLLPGDAIYIPYHWWHGVESLDPVNLFVNYWWSDAPEGIGSPYDVLMHALMTLRDLPAEQRAVWRTIFDHYVFQTNGDPAAHLPEEAKGILGPPSRERLAWIKANLKQIVGRL